MLSEKELERKYAYNINNKQKNQQIKGSGNDFEKINKSFYDEIERTDMRLKLNKNNLHNKKLNLVKEMIYTNKSIPICWKKKVNFPKQIMNMFIKDEQFLSYLGRGASTDRILNNDNSNSNKKLKKNLSHKNYFVNKELSINKYYNENQNKSIDEESSEMSIGNNHYKKKIFKKNQFSDHEVKQILENYKTNYPLKESLIKELNIKKNDKKKNSILSKLLSEEQLNKTQKKILNPFIDINKMKPEKRRKLYRQGIFTNLIPQNTSLTTRSKSNIDIKKSLNEDKFISINLEKIDSNVLASTKSFYKKIEINDPIKNKYLKLLKFYGPYYSFCPPCNNRNMEFYNQLERNQCFKLLDYMKKEKNKNKLIESHIDFSSFKFNI